MESIVAYIGQLEPFNRLDPETLRRVAERVQREEFPPLGWLVEQGSRPDGSLLILVEGNASIVTGQEGEERVVGACQPGDFAGLSGALTGEPHPVGVRADGCLCCMRLPPDAVDLCLSNPNFAAYFSRMLAKRLRKAYTEVSAEHRTHAVDTQPFRRRVVDLMRTPVPTCTPDTTVGELARQIRDRAISSTVVVEGDDLIGFVTAYDLVAKALAEGYPPDTPVRAVMSAPVLTVPVDAFYYEALLRMVRGGFKHLPVVDRRGRLSGMVTLGYLTRIRVEGALSAVDQIERESTVEGLSAIVTHVDEVLRALVAEGWQPFQILPVISELYDRLTRRIITLAIECLGEPPCDWCWLNLGSAGREEQFTRSDQDNAIVYAGERDEVDGYFARLAAFVVNGLAQVGFARCPGNVMATNPQWRKSVRDWRFQIIAMVSRPVPEQVRLGTIFLDFRPVAGNAALAATLREQLWLAVDSLPLFLYHLVRDDLQHAVPIGAFRRLITPLWGEHKGQLNLKTEACVHVVDLLRALAIKYRIAETSTLGRLRALVRAGALSHDEGEWLEIAYQTLLRLRIHLAIQALQSGEPPGHYVHVALLSEPERAALKDALVAVARLQETVGIALSPGGAI